MNRLESELLDLEELLMRNDGIADDGTYSTIVGIANDVSKLEEENDKLWEYVKWLEDLALRDPSHYRALKFEVEMKRRDLGIEADE